MCWNIHTDRAKPLEQEPGPSRVLELYTGPALAQVVWRDLYLPDLFVIQLLLLVSFRFFSLSLLSDIIDGERDLNLIRDESTGKVKHISCYISNPNVTSLLLYSFYPLN